MRGKNIKTIIIHDIVYGIQVNRYKYILVLLFFMYLNVSFFNNINIFRLSGIIEESPSIVDCWIYIVRGMGIYIPSKEMPFQIPIYWLMTQVLLAFLILSYPTQDLDTYGIQILTRTRSKCLWWVSKSLWNICTVVSFYCIGFFIVTIFSIFSGNASFEPHILINNEINQINLENFRGIYLYIAIFILPIVTSIALSMLQMTISFVLSPILSYIILVCYIVASAYYCFPLLIGNFTMLLRNNVIEPMGSDNMSAIAVSLFVYVIAFVTGLFYFKKSDILKKR